MVLDFILKYLPPDKGSLPNKFTIGMGELIRMARVEAGMSQVDLAKNIYVRQSTLSKIENGKLEASSSVLIYLAGVLNKPIMYFFPKPLIRHLNPNKFDDVQFEELIVEATQLEDDDLNLITSQIKSLKEFKNKK